MDLQRGRSIGLADSNSAGNRLRRTAIHGCSVLDTRALGSRLVGDALHHIRGADQALDTIKPTSDGLPPASSWKSSKSADRQPVNSHNAVAFI